MSLAIALIGYGRAGACHLAASNRIDAVDVACVIDPYVTKLFELGVPVFDSIDEAVASIRLSAVIVAAPPATHADLVIAAMRRGLDVLVEKPMALSVADCDRMLEAQVSTNCVLMVGHTYHFDRVLQRARDVVQAGELGRPIWLYEHVVRPRPVTQPTWMDGLGSGGLLMSNGVHLIDRTLWLLGGRVASAYAEIRRRGVGPDAARDGELACMTLAFASGTVATLLLAEPTSGPSSRIAEAVLDSGRLRYAEDLEIGRGDQWTSITIDKRDPFELQLEAFAMAIGSRHADPDGLWGRTVVEVATLAERRPWSSTSQAGTS